MTEPRYYNCLGSPGTLITDEDVQIVVGFMGEEYATSTNFGAGDMFLALCVSCFVPLSGQRKFAEDHGEEVVKFKGINRLDGAWAEIPLAELWLAMQSGVSSLSK